MFKKSILFLLFTFIFFNPLNANPFESPINLLLDNKFEKAQRVIDNLPESKEKHILKLIAYDNPYQINQFSEFFYNFITKYQDIDPYIFAFNSSSLSLANINPRDKTAENIFEYLIENNSNNIILSNTYQNLYNMYEDIGEFDERDEIGEKLNTIVDWSSVGTFENISASGFDKDYKPIFEHTRKSTFTNKNGAKVKWYDLKGINKGSWIFLKNSYYINNSIIFLQTFVTTKESKDVAIKFGRSGSLKIWLNDTQIFEDEEERNTGIDNNTIITKLSAGTNRILVQLGDSEINNSNLIMRITDLKGNKIENLVFSSFADNYNKNADIKFKTQENFAINYFKNLILDNNDFINRYLLVKSLLYKDEYTKAYKYIKEMEKIAPKSIIILNMKSELFSRQGNNDAAKYAYEELINIDSESYYALYDLMQEHLEAENFDELKKTIKKIQSKFGRSKKLFFAKLSTALRDEDQSRITELVDYYYKLYPYDNEIVRVKFDVENSMKKNPDKAFSIIEEYVEDYYNFSILNIYVRELFKRNKINEGIDVYYDILEYFPRKIGWLSELAFIYKNIEKYDDALEMIDRCINLAPYVGQYYAERASIYDELNNKDMAINNYEIALKYDQNQYNVIQKLRNLRNEKDLFDYFEDIDYSQIYIDAPSEVDYPDEKAIILLDEERRVVYDNGASEKRVFMLAKTFNEEGVDMFKEYYVGYEGNQDYVIEKAVLLKQTGSEIKAEVNDNQIVFTNLEPGDGIYIQYKLQDYKYGTFSKHIWDKFLFEGYSTPVIKTAYSILSPSNFDFKYKVMNSDIKPVIKDINKYRILNWSFTNDEKVEYESMMPSNYDCLPILHISSIPNWQFISKWYYDISKTKSKPDYEIKELVKKLINGDDLSDLEKAKRIYDYIVTNIRYSFVPFRQNGIIPQKASSMLITKIGDCKDVATLFNSMCQVADVETKLVLVNTRNKGTKYNMLPSIDFNHVIAYLKYKDKDYYIDLTSDKFDIGTIYGNNYGAESLIIDKNAHADIKIEHLKPIKEKENNIIRHSKVSFNENKMICDISTIRTAGYAGSQRYTYDNKSKEEKEKNMLQAIASDIKTKVELNSLSFNGLDEISDTLEYYYNYTVYDALTEIAGLNIFDIPITDRLPDFNFLDLDERKYPIDLYQSITTNMKFEEIVIKYPENQKLAEIPENINIDNEILSYNLIFSEKEGELFISRKLKIKNFIIEPKDYLLFKDIAKKIVKADYQKLGFVKK